MIYYFVNFILLAHQVQVATCHFRLPSLLTVLQSFEERIFGTRTRTVPRLCSVIFSFSKKLLGMFKVAITQLSVGES